MSLNEVSSLHKGLLSFWRNVALNGARTYFMRIEDDSTK